MGCGRTRTLRIVLLHKARPSATTQKNPCPCGQGSFFLIYYRPPTVRVPRTRAQARKEVPIPNERNHSQHYPPVPHRLRHSDELACHQLPDTESPIGKRARPAYTPFANPERMKLSNCWRSMARRLPMKYSSSSCVERRGSAVRHTFCLGS